MNELDIGKLVAVSQMLGIEIFSNLETSDFTRQGATSMAVARQRAAAGEGRAGGYLAESGETCESFARI